MGIGVGRTFFMLLLVLDVRSAAAARSSPVAVAGAKAGQQGSYSVLDFHAAGDGQTDDAPVTASAFLEAWQAACNDGSSPNFVIPGGRTFLLSKIRFQGSCKSPMTVQLDGNIVAPNYIWTAQPDNLLTFYRIDNLTVAGNGQIDGRGAIWWTCYNQKRCTYRPILLAFASCDNLWVRNIHLKDSPDKHMTLYRCSQVHVDSVSVTAPADSPNTDGINMALSDHVYISSCSFQTGDDCVSILSGTTDVNVTDTTCGPGHGISVGSLGGANAIALVERITVSNCSFVGTLTGVRIKSWQGGTGKANGFLFENLNMTAVRIPIDIDQFYCPQGNCPTKDGGVAITDVRFVNIHGTSADKQAIQILCSQSVPCRGIYLDDVTLYWDKENSQAQSKVLNAQGTIVGDVVPEVQFGTQR